MSNISFFQNSSKSNGAPYYTGNRSGSTRRLKYLSGVSNHDPMTRKHKREMLNGMGIKTLPNFTYYQSILSFANPCKRICHTIFICLGYSRSVPNVNDGEDDNEHAANPGSSTLPKRTSSDRSKLPTYKQALIASRFNYPRSRRSSYSFSEDR